MLTASTEARTLHNMNTFVEVEPFLVREYVGEIAFLAEDAEKAAAALLSRLDALPPASLLVVDFAERKVASDAARALLRRPLKRIIGGELEDRYLVLKDLGASEYSVGVMLKGEGLVAVERTDEGPELQGAVDPAVRDSYEKLLSSETLTASQLRDALQLNNISTATNRLTNLAALGLARRIEFRPASKGGREYVYAAVR